jgi:ribosomal protein S12 methylthiotransferase
VSSSPPAASSAGGRVAVVTLGCGRNEVDSDQVAGSLHAAGLQLVDDPDDADCVVVNTCTFIAPAREESIATVLDACDLDARVLVIGCMAQRYGDELADALPEVAGVLGFADYPRLPQIVRSVLAGGPARAGDGPGSALASTAGRRSLPLLAPEPAPQPAPQPALRAPDAPPTAAFPVRTVPRGPWAYLKIAGGCDRVCTFCTIPSFRGRFTSRPAEELVAEATWLTQAGVRELVCVSENTTSWGKDLPGGRRGQAELIRALEAVPGLERLRLLYLQPAEITPALLDAMAASPVVAPYYDLSLQHASAPVLQRMGRSGSAERFLELIASIRRRDPEAVFRSSFIVGFPGETAADVEVLEQFLLEAGLDWAGFFPFSVEDGTPSATMPAQVDPSEARARRDRLVDVAEQVAAAQAEAFLGRELDVLVESCEDGEDGQVVLGRSYREGPEVDGEVRVRGCQVPVGRSAAARVVAVDGVDLEAIPLAAVPLAASPLAASSLAASPLAASPRPAARPAGHARSGGVRAGA